MPHYTKEQLRSVFQRPFDKETWKTILIDIFRANNVRVEPEKFTDLGQSETGWYMGNIETPDNYRIGLFFYRINSGSVAHKKVGLRNLVKSWVNPNWGEFDAAIVVFSDEADWRLSFVCDIKDVATSPKRFTFVFGEKDNFYRTPIERFTTLQAEAPTFKNIRKAFSVEALSDDFFDQYREHYAGFVEFLTGKRYVKEGTKWIERETGKPDDQYRDTFRCDDRMVRDYIKKMFGRIVFLYFLQRKGWLDGNRNYMHDLFANSDKKDNFLDGVLEPLFFEVLNTDKPYRTAAAKALPGSDNIPYLNGGLFAADEIDELDCKFPESLFSKLFDFLDSYNFTIDENDTDDAEIGIDPEMLGRIFENLLEDNKDKGAFYTPKEIVDYMCRESIIAYLQNDKFTDSGNETIRKFVETYDGASLSVDQRKYLKDKLKSVKICDPAIGSGAFPMGLVNLLSKLYTALRLSTDAAVIKRHIMEQNIYGVDIEKGAVDIARLRFWLAMIVEEKDPIPLPNLHFKIMQGNSLLESYNGRSLADLTEVEVEHEVGTLDLDFDTAEQKSLVESLRSYYGESNHNVRDQLFDTIIKNVRRQINNRNISLPSGFDPSANDKFFLWHTWFKDVFDQGGFDIVIGNPPYIDSETMSDIMPTERKIYKGVYNATAHGNWDIFIIFIELGFKLLKDNGKFAYIIPNKVIAAKYAEACRLFIQEFNLLELRDYGTISVFDAAVYPCTLIIDKSSSKSTKVFRTMSDLTKIGHTSYIPADLFDKDILWDKYFISEQLLNIIFKISNNPILKYQTEINITAAATVAEAYEIKEVIGESDKIQSPNFKFINTGTIDKYTSLWGIKATQYIKGKYFRPVVALSDLENISHNRTLQSQSPKLIFAGMSSSIEGLYDNGEYLAGKSTSIITCNSDTKLKYILGIANSQLFDFWLKTNFNSLKMAGGYINVGVNELSQLPIKFNCAFSSILVSLVDALIENPSDAQIIKRIDQVVYHLYNLTYNEILAINPKTDFTREEYENFNLED